MEFIVKGPPAGRYGPAGDAHSGYRAGRRERSQPRARHDYRFRGCAGAALDAGGFAGAASAAQLQPWLGNVTPVRTRRLYFSEKPLDPNNPNERDGVLPHGGRPDAGGVRSELGRAEYRREARNGGGLDHREPLERAARLPHPSTAFHAAGLCREAGERAFSARYGQRPLLQRPSRSSIRACDCGWISAIRIPSARLFITAICWSTRTAG